MHGIANPENRQFESDSHFQRNYMDVIPGYHAKSRDICEWVIQNYSHVVCNMTVILDNPLTNVSAFGMIARHYVHIIPLEV